MVVPENEPVEGVEDHPSLEDIDLGEDRGGENGDCGGDKGGQVYDDSCELGNWLGEDFSMALEVGMVYNSWEAVEVAYKTYAMSVGFGVSRCQSAYSPDKKSKRAMTWRCERWGDPETKFGTLPHLRVLVLRSNHFQGKIKYYQKAQIKPFPKLQILDISGNHFCGKLPTRYIENFKAMMVSNNSDRYIGMSNVYSDYYHDSLVLTVKGNELPYERILSILASFDFSSNNFSGDIPNSVGQLVTLKGLNMSHNNLTGHIPPCLAILSSLEFLDLSCNKLEGEIPPQLVRLTFLEVFNVSNNKLDGPIPQGSQFGTFLNDSYEGNLGLCGDPLPKCGEHDGALDHQPATPESKQEGNDIIDIITSISLCEIILLGFGLGTVLGSSIGYCMLSARKSNWLSRKADRFEGVMVQRFKKRSGRKQRT